MAGHIPAGMELFAAGDQSQMQVIKQWIDESDVYLLILGGRYGSIESTSQKSYIHLEYEYAIERNKPFFVIVITDTHLEEKVKTHGSQVMETEHGQKLRDFKNIVRSRMVRFWSNPLEIKLAIYETLNKFSDRPDVVGWVPGNEAINTGPAIEEFARLTKENTELRQQLASLSTAATSQREEQYRLALNWDSKTRLRGFDLSHRDLSGLTLTKADLAGSELCNAVLETSRLEQASLTRAHLNNANLRRANLRRAALRGANLRRAALRGADLREADLTGADLDGADLAGADLRGADLTRANLRGAALAGATLAGADLTGAALAGATLAGANLREATLAGARYDPATQWPGGFDYQGCGATDSP
jgi:uncharacterized protein YjbI with pentapeptide repeats